MLLQLIYLKYLLFIVTIILSIGISFLGKSGYLGVRLQTFFNYKSLGELFLVVVMVSSILMLFINSIIIIYSYFYIVNNINVCVSSGIDERVNAPDPVRFWPSGTAQTWGILGTAAAVYRGMNGSNKVKVAAALSSLGITIPLNVYLHAVENPNGFNRLMYSWAHYKEHGVWPASFSSEAVDRGVANLMSQYEAETQEQVSNISNSSKFLPDSYNEILSQFSPENLFLNFIGLFKPVGVEGHLDDLIGQQLLIHFLLIIVVTSLIILFIFYFVVQTMFNNKEFILAKFNNRFIKLYIKYQIFLAKISLIILPLLIMLGLVELFVGLYFIITHPIPFEVLDIDLHTYINSKKK